MGCKVRILLDERAWVDYETMGPWAQICKRPLHLFYTGARHRLCGGCYFCLSFVSLCSHSASIVSVCSTETLYSAFNSKVNMEGIMSWADYETMGPGAQICKRSHHLSYI